jgi:flagellar M-ring protein FliF
VNGISQTLRNLGPTRLAVIAAVGVAVVAFFVYLTARMSTPPMALLYGELQAADSSRIVAQLETSGVAYELRAGGAQVYVPSDVVDRVRLQMAAEGLPSGGSVGYEIFDQSETLGTTRFVNDINQLRALEGELARTISSLQRIDAARVHLVLPRREPFSRRTQEPSAAVVLRLRGGSLEAQQVAAVRHLVAAAVPGLETTHISIVDQRGNLLARSGGDAAEFALQNAEEMRVRYENRLRETVETLVERIVGPGKVRAEVSAEMDFDRIERNTEDFDPEGQVVRSTNTVEESEASTEGGDASVSVANNLPGADPALGDGGAQSQSSRTEETVNYEISRTVESHVVEGGNIERLSVAVLVDGNYTATDGGEPTYEPRGQEELDQIDRLVKSAIGFDEARKDTVEVVNLQFATAEIPDDLGEAPFLGLTKNDLMRLAEMLVLAVVGVLVVLLVVRPLLSRALDTAATAAPGALPPQQATALLADHTGAAAPPQIAGPPGAAPAPPQQAPASRKASPAVEAMIDLQSVEGRVKESSVRKVGEIVDKHPEEAVAIIRNWMYEHTK